MSIVATIEARMTSSRLPGKMTLPLGADTVLGVLIDRLKQVSELDGVMLATTINTADDVLVDVARQKDILFFRGSEDDVLGRVRGALDAAGADVCVEITGDCPLTDPAMVSRMIREFFDTRNANAYIANTTGPVGGAPHGLDVQVFEAEALRRIEEEAGDPEAREHVSAPFYRDGLGGRWNPRFVSFFPADLSRKVWLSLDYREDYELIRAIYDELAPRDRWFGAEAMVEAALARPQATRTCLALRGWA